MRPTLKNPNWLAVTKAKGLCFKKCFFFALKIIVVPFKSSLNSTYLPWINSVTHSRSAAWILHAPTSPLVHGRHTRYLLSLQPQDCSWHLCSWRSVTPVCLFGTPWSLLVLILNFHTLFLSFKCPLKHLIISLLFVSSANSVIWKSNLSSQGEWLTFSSTPHGPVAHRYVEESFLPS